MGRGFVTVCSNTLWRRRSFWICSSAALPAALKGLITDVIAGQPRPLASIAIASDGDSRCFESSAFCLDHDLIGFARRGREVSLQDVERSRRVGVR